MISVNKDIIENMKCTAYEAREITIQKKIRRLELYIFPLIGNKTLTKIKSPDIFGIIKPLIQKNQLKTSARLAPFLLMQFPMIYPITIQL